MSDTKGLGNLERDYLIFASRYPVARRVGGKPARRAWYNAMHGDPGEEPQAGPARFEAMMAAVEQHKRSEQWQTPKLIPLMTTWLNQHRWVQVLPEPEEEPLTVGETHHATEVRNRVYGGCRHEPRCAGVQACVEAIALDIRSRKGRPEAPRTIGQRPRDEDEGPL